MKHLADRLIYGLRQTDRMLLLGCVLIGLTPLLYWTMTRPLQQRLAMPMVAPAQASQAIPRSTVSDQEMMRHFYRQLPSAATTPDLLEKIFDAAYENNLSPEQGEFKWIPSQEARFTRYQIDVPVTGSYPDLRKFLHRVLEEIPTLSLDEVSFSREDVKQAEVETRVRFSLYVRRGT